MARRHADDEPFYPPYREDSPWKRLAGYAVVFGLGVGTGWLLFGPAFEPKPKKEPTPAPATAAPTAAAPEPAAAPTAASPTPGTAFLMDEPPAVEEPAAPPAAVKPPPTKSQAKTRSPAKEPGETYVTPPAKKTPAGAGPRTPESIRATVTKRLAGIQAEYDAQLKKNPRMGGGKVSVRFTIAASGEVTAAEVVEDTVGNPALAAAVVARVRSWRFAPAAGETTVIYPFVFVAGR